MPTPVEISISLPPAGCTPNTYRHWRSKGRAVKQYREEGRIYGLASGVRLAVPVRVHHDWYMGKTVAEKIDPKDAVHKRYRPLDEANAIAALKGAIDGLVDAGVLKSDTHEWLKWGECRLLRTAKAHGGRSGVVLRFEVVG